MKKTIKILEIVLISLAICCGIALIIGYVLFKDSTIEILNSIKDFINQPLPIIGVSILGFSISVYELAVRLNFGKRALTNIIAEKDNELERIKAKEIELEKIKVAVETTLKEQDVNIDELKQYIVELCGYSRNIKAHELAERIEKGETTDGEENKNGEAIEE